MAHETNDRTEQSRMDEREQQNPTAETDRPDPGETNSETAKDIHVVRGDDHPQTVRHSG